MTILVADDHPIFRKGMVQVLQLEFRNAKFLEVEDGRKVVDTLQQQEVDILLLDIQMPVMNGYEVLDIILHQKSKTKVIICSLIDSPQAVDHFFERGVKGYISKAADFDEFFEGIKVVLAGGVYIEKKLSAQYLKATEPVKLKLSHQETQVLRHLSSGLNAAEIGESMGLSMRTVEDYKTSMMKKTRVKNTADLVRFFYENGLN